MSSCLVFAPMIGARPGELNPLEAEAFAEHLATCAACQTRLSDAEALSSLLPEALLAEANRRDFATFSDGVLARIPALAPRRAKEGFALGAFVRRHRLLIASALVPALLALSLLVYLALAAPEPAALVDVVAEGRSATVLETRDGPVVLLGDEGS